MGQLAEEDKIKRLIKISRNWYTVSEKNGKRYFNDLRFGQISIGQDQPFVFSYELDYSPTGELTLTETEKSFDGMGDELVKLFGRVLGRK